MSTINPAGVEIRRVKTLDAAGHLQAARLVQLAIPPYYATLPPDRADKLVCAELAENGVELEHCEAAIADGQVAGILCTYPMDELAERQFQSFQLVARTLEREEFAAFAANLRTLRAGLPEIAGTGRYLAFIAVDPRWHGTGLAGALVARAIGAASPNPLFLTVRNENARALALYRKHGFVSIAEAATFRLLRRDAGDAGEPSAP